MERKSIDLYLPYNDDGEFKNKIVKISFISQRMIREYADMQKAMIELITLNEQYKEVNRKIFDVYKGGLKNLTERKGKYKELAESQARLKELLEVKATEDFFKRKVDLMIMILERNGVKDSQLLSYEFWDECVLPEDFTAFMESCMKKDIPEKKKNPQSAMKSG